MTILKSELFSRCSELLDTLGTSTAHPKQNNNDVFARRRQASQPSETQRGVTTDPPEEKKGKKYIAQRQAGGRGGYRERFNSLQSVCTCVLVHRLSKLDRLYYTQRVVISKDIGSGAGLY